jgi:hypothetical protein
MSFAVNGFAYFITQYKNLPQKVLDDIKFDYKPGPAPPPPLSAPPGISAEDDRIARFDVLCNANSLLQFLGNTADDYAACFPLANGYLQYFNQPAGVDLKTATQDNIEEILEKIVEANIVAFREEQERTVERTINTDILNTKVDLESFFVSHFFERALENLKYELKFAEFLYDDAADAKDDLDEIESLKEAGLMYYPMLGRFEDLEWSYVGRFLKTFKSQCEPYLRPKVIDQAKLNSEFPPSGKTMLQVFAEPHLIPDAVKYLQVFDASVDVTKPHTEAELKSIVDGILAKQDAKFLTEVKEEQDRTVRLQVNPLPQPTELLQDEVKKYESLTKAEVFVGAPLFQLLNGKDFIDNWDLNAIDQIVPHLEKIRWTFMGAYYTRHFRAFAKLELAAKFKATKQHSLLQVLAQANEDHAKFQEYFEYLHAFRSFSFTSNTMTHEEVKRVIGEFLFVDKSPVKEEQEHTVSIALKETPPPTKSNLINVRNMLTKSLTEENSLAVYPYGDEADPLQTCAKEIIKPTLSAADFFQFIAHLQGIKWCFAGQYYHTFQQQIISALA